LFGHTAYAIAANPLVIGSQGGTDGRLLTVGSAMPGVSRRHCSLANKNGQCIIEDHSRYGTFLNGHRIDGSAVLQVGDGLRIGSPGFEFQLISAENAHG
jgi:pSer/pThr/pTyr-binding forkhead associated (FHA) protein